LKVVTGAVVDVPVKVMKNATHPVTDPLAKLGCISHHSLTTSNPNTKLLTGLKSFGCGLSGCDLITQRFFAWFQVIRSLLWSTWTIET